MSAATAKQLRYLKSLARKRGESFAWPETSAEAAAEIRRMRGTRTERSSRNAVKLEGSIARDREKVAGTLSVSRSVASHQRIKRSVDGSAPSFDQERA